MKTTTVQVIKIFLNRRLSDLPKNALFRFNGKMYQKTLYNRSSKIYHCLTNDEYDPGACHYINFSGNEIVQHYVTK